MVSWFFLAAGDPASISTFQRSRRKEEGQKKISQLSVASLISLPSCSRQSFLASREAKIISFSFQPIKLGFLTKKKKSEWTLHS